MSTEPVENWDMLGDDALAAAGECMRNKRNRSAVSRAYYAAFSKVTAALLREGFDPRNDLGTWPHQKLPGIAKSGLKKLIGVNRTAELKRLLSNLYTIRIIADYMPGQTVDGETVKRSMRYALAISQSLERLS